MIKLIKANLSHFKTIKEHKDHIYLKAKTGPSKVTKIPKKLNKNLCIFAGIIIGDGHIRKDKKRVEVELTDYDLIQKISKLSKILFATSSKIFPIIDKRITRKKRYRLVIGNAVICDLLNKILEIPRGKKADIVSVPSLIKSTSLKNQNAFLLGLFVADGGKRHGNYLGLSTASKQLRSDVSTLLKNLRIDHKTDQWIYKKYKKEYFGLYFARKNLPKLLRECRSGQTGQIRNSFLRKIGGQA